MIDQDRLKAATDGVMTAALLGEDWKEPLARLAEASGARDAVLMRNVRDRMLTAVVTDEAEETVAAFAAGKAPPNSRYNRVHTEAWSGFRVDHDDYSEEELERDPFYQEFLRPAGVFWHANATLESTPHGHIELSFKRRVELGPYSRDDAICLDAILPDLRAASRLTFQMLDAEVRGMVHVFKARGILTLEIDRTGRVLATHEARADNALPLDVVNRRLIARDRSCQAGIDRAILSANDHATVGLAAVTGNDQRRFILQVHPLPGRARDLFVAATSIAVLMERDRPVGHSRASSRAIAQLFGLTDREVEVACLRAEGMELPAIAALLGISPDTVRTYLKFAYDKIGVNRQAELVALINRLIT